MPDSPISPELLGFYQQVQKACLPGVWSKGVALARDRLVQLDSQLDSQKADEIILRVRGNERAVSCKVSLWPADEDSYCDCGGPTEPCAHIAAAVAALKNGLLVEPVGQATDTRVRYRLAREGRWLRFERWLGDRLLDEPLVRLVGGLGSGRVAGPPLATTQDDFTIDQALGLAPALKPDRAAFAKLLVALRSIGEIELDGAKAQAGTPTRGLHAELRDDAPGFRLVGVEDPTITEVFENGVVLCGDVLRALEDPGLTAEERRWLAPPGRFFPLAEVPALLSEIVPALEKKLSVRVLARKLPQVSEADAQSPPRIVLRLEHAAEGVLAVTPTIAYASEYSVRDPDGERRLGRQLQSELQLAPGQRAEFRGMAAVDFVRRAREWDTAGDGAAAFALREPLVGAFSADEQGLTVTFSSGGASGGAAVDPARVFEAWREGASLVPLLGGGYAALPLDWLARFGSRLARLLAARDAHGKLAPHFRPELADLAAEAGGEVSDPLAAMRRTLETFDRIPESPLPSDLRAELRHYQRQGVNWLGFLRDAGMGALLADDMGLGKTLQALCAIRGRALVVTPTSVLHSWAEQIRRFRPGLSISLYYGPGRVLDPGASITLTSYGVLRQDIDALSRVEWDTAVLDEAQLIKNPESQVAQAAHRLPARFRLTLSGTPVENSSEDLWSQFQFLNPGLLGTKREFQDELAGPVARGDLEAARRLRARIRPFVLRRLKRDVAPELPPRTEVVLRAELSPPEREIYEMLLAAGKREVIEKLEEGGSVFGALELLLRLRQACCHPSLIPGQSAETSAKLELLASTLESSLAQGHRALVFSQWTSFLDLIGPRLTAQGVTWSRLDGGTPGARREELVREFQAPDGPSVMLISLKAGGVGLNLTAADHVYLMDSWWNPAVEDQAADRVHRIGQENPVLVSRLVAENTLEERIYELQKRKLEVASAVLEGTGQAVSLTREDILALLE